MSRVNKGMFIAQWTTDSMGDEESLTSKIHEHQIVIQLNWLNCISVKFIKYYYTVNYVRRMALDGEKKFEEQKNKYKRKLGEIDDNVKTFDNKRLQIHFEQNKGYRRLKENKLNFVSKT